MLGRIVVMGLCLIAVACPDGALTANLPIARAAPPAAAPVQAGVPAAPALSQVVAAPNPSPARLVIARIGVNATIEARGLDANRNIETPNDFHDVAWFDQGPMPGQPGNALINGHVDWWTGSAVFTRLGEVRPGDLVIVVRGDGTQLSFKVTGRRTVAAGDRVAALFAPSSAATLTLITCTGVWDPRILSDTQRLLVSATLA